MEVCFMKLIGASLPRTGSLTQKVALEMLGAGPCYHMVNVLADLDLAPLWRAAYEGNADWDRIFDGFESTVDWPGGYFYRELMEKYANAKVLLSVRDPEKWERSMRDTVWGIVNGDVMIAHLSRAVEDINPKWHTYIELVKRLLWIERGTFADLDHASRDGLIQGFNRYIETVKSDVPSDKLLVWQPSDGWEPLCEFLEADVPDVPVPHLNDSREFVQRIVEMTMLNLQAWKAQEAGQPTPA
jgi:hypothetical protein